MTDRDNVRDQLTLIARDVHLYDGRENAALYGTLAQRIADAILSRFDVTPKGQAPDDVIAEAERIYPIPAPVDYPTTADYTMRVVFVQGQRTGYIDAAKRASQPVTEDMLGIMAQRFYEASGLSVPMSAKPEIVSGLRAALEAAREAGR